MSQKPGERCLMCGQVIGVPSGRVCGDCHKPIARHDRWYFGPEGKPVHRDCSNPTMEERRK
jgi:hypothetical protein